jgi:hypothetical protein
MVHFVAETKFDENGKQIGSDDVGYPQFKEYGTKPLLKTLFGFDTTDDASSAKVLVEETLTTTTDPIVAVKKFFQKQAVNGAAAAAFKAEMSKAASEFGGRFVAPNFERDTQVIEVSEHLYHRVPESNFARTFLVMVPYTSSFHGGFNLCDNFVMAIDYEEATSTTGANLPAKVKAYGWKQVPDFGKIL